MNPSIHSPDVSADDGGAAARFAQGLLSRFGLEGGDEGAADHPALAWRRAGLLEITGRRDQPGLVSPVALTTVADGALMALRALAPGADLPENGALLLGERARLMGLRRQGDASANGSARLIQTADGHIALNLPREDDWSAMPALLGEDAGNWADVARHAASQSTAQLVAQGRLLGLAIAAEQAPQSTELFTVSRGEEIRPPSGDPPLVVDLSALWAGPLAGSLLAMAGARVVKVESLGRPDGAREGHAPFYDLLNADKASVAVDFADPVDMQRLRLLVDAADVVIESTRPRALAHLGISARDVVARGATWLSITGYGRTGEVADWIGFGDDAAVAGGLSAAMRRAWGESLFAGDAIADPLTGMIGAFAALATWRTGGGLVSVALADVVGHACSLGDATGETLEVWQSMAQGDRAPMYPLRTVRAAARPLGADTGTVLQGL